VAVAVGVDAQAELGPVEVDLDAPVAGLDVDVDERVGHAAERTRARNVSSSRLRVPALPAELASSAATGTSGLCRPLARAIAAPVAATSRRLRKAASWITLASCWASSTSLRSTSDARDGGHRNAARDSHIPRIEATARVHADRSCGPAAPRRDDADARRVPPSQLPQRRRPRAARLLTAL
jgi:hypothetical protein